MRFFPRTSQIFQKIISNIIVSYILLRFILFVLLFMNFRFFSNNNYKTDDEIYYNLENQGLIYPFIVYGISIENYPYDCFDLTFLTEE